MAKTVLADVGVWIAGESYAGVSNGVTLDASATAVEATTIGDEWREFLGGLSSSAFSLEGFFDDRDEDQFDSVAAARSVMVVPDEMDPGDVAYIVPVTVSAHNLSGSVGEMFAFSYASQGDGRPFRGRVMDIREGLDAGVNQTLQDFGAIPSGHAQRIWIHVNVVTAGTIRIALRSSTAATGATVHQRAVTADIDQTGVYELSVQHGALNPITDQFWGLGYSVTSLTGEFDIAAATLYGEAHIVIPSTPVTPAPPPPTRGELLGGLSADASPVASELTIDGMNNQLTVDAFTAQYILIARLASESDITSIIFASAPSMNEIGNFTKFGSTVSVGGHDYNVWVSNAQRTFAAQDVITIASPVTLRGGLSADATAQVSELTIDGANNQLTFAPFTNMHIVIARDASRPDITSVILASDPTMDNQFPGFTKQGNQLVDGGATYNVWVSNQSLTFTAQDILNVR